MSASEILQYLGVPDWKVPLMAADMRRRMMRDLGRIGLFVGVEPMLKRLADAGLRLGIASSNAAANIQQVLGSELWQEIHDAECGAAIFAKHVRLTRLLRRARVAPGHAIYIGDEIRDIEAARRAGIAVGAVTWGYNQAGVLRRHEPDLLFEQVHEIADRLLGKR
ncbi:MAG: HAD hydrolase-like protein, partial [Thiohalocapsa sp.]